MANEAVELFVHRHGDKPRIVVAEPHEIIREVLMRAEIKTDDEDVAVFVGEWEEALDEPIGVENGEDAHTVADVTLTVEVLELHRHRHIHVHRCRRIATEVEYLGAIKRHRFSPATTVGVVTAWARKKFGLDPAAGADFVLQICGSSTKPRANEHLGELAHAPVCALCFKLVKEITPQG